MEYGPIKGRDDFEIVMPSLPDKGLNDSGVHTPLSAQSSASSIDTNDKEETIRMKKDGTTRQRQDEERTTIPAINNTNSKFDKSLNTYAYMIYISKVDLTNGASFNGSIFK